MPRSVYAAVVALSLAASACVMVEDDDIDVVELDSYQDQSDGADPTIIVWEAVTTSVAGQTVLFIGQTPNGEAIDPASIEATIEGGDNLGTSVEGATVEQFVGAYGGTIEVIVIGKGIGTSP